MKTDFVVEFAVAVSVFVLLATAPRVTGTPPPSSCLIDWSDVRQRIDGFGGGVVFLNPGSLDPVTAANMDTLFGTNAGQLALTLLRIRIDPTTNWSVALSDAQKAVARGAGVLATPWTPPASMKDNGLLTNGSVLPSQYANYGAYLKSFWNYMATNGAPLRAISIQNEPDWTDTYETCLWSATQFLNFFHTNSGAFSGMTVMMPESLSFNFSYSDPSLNDPIAVTNISLVGGHLYGVTTIQDYSNAHAKGKPTWMTEFLLNDQSIGSAVATGDQIHQCLTTGNMSAYIWWKCLGDANGIVNASGVAQNRGFVMAQFSKFVRPGYSRVGTANNSIADVSAYKGPTGAFAIVAVNTNTADVTQTFTLTNCLVTSPVTPWITSSNLLLAQQTAVPVTGNSFTYTLPAVSVMTFVGQVSNPPPVINSISILGGYPTLSVGGPSGFKYTLLTSTNPPNWQPLLTTNPLALPLTFVDTNAATDAARFYRVQINP